MKVNVIDAVSKDSATCAYGQVLCMQISSPEVSWTTIRDVDSSASAIVQAIQTKLEYLYQREVQATNLLVEGTSI